MIDSQAAAGAEGLIVLEALRQSKEIDAPTIIIANTRKGHGVSFWDNSPLSHGSWGPTEQEYSEAKNELEKRRNEIMNIFMYFLSKLSDPFTSRFLFFSLFLHFLW